VLTTVLDDGSGNMIIGGNTTPKADSSHTLGSSSLYWSNTYTDRLYLNSTAYLDGGTAGTVDVTGNIAVSGTVDGVDVASLNSSVSNVDNTSDQTKNLNNSLYNVKDYGATGDGTTNDTTDVQAAIDACEAAGGGVVYFPEGHYMVNPLTVDSSYVTIRGVGRSSLVQLIAQNLTTLGDHGVFEIYGTGLVDLVGMVVEHIAIDGNKGNHTGTAGLNMELIDAKYWLGGVIQNCFLYNSISEGVDIDESDFVLIQANEIRNTGGNGIHISTNSTRCRVMNNFAEDCGEDWTRSGIDQHSSASDSLYVGNYCIGNYRNYNIVGSGATFTGNKSIGTGVTAADVYSGATGNKEVVRYRAHTTDSMLGDAETVIGWGYIQGDGSLDYANTSVVFPTAFNAVPIVTYGGVGNKSSVPANAGDTTNAITANRSNTWIIANVTTTGFDILVKSSSTIPTSQYHVFHWSATGQLFADTSE